MLLLIVLLAIFQYIEANVPCNLRKLDTGFVCVCNATYCDTTPEIGYVGHKTFKITTTSNKNPGFVEKKGFLTKIQDPSSGKLTLNGNEYQTIFGFGGAFTDATGSNIKSLSTDTQHKLLESYFSDKGIEYSLCRTPIAGCDFSPRPYSYDDVDGDVELKHFSLQKEDFDYKIPLIKAAKNLRNGKQFNLFASAWTAPPWMKNNKVWSGYSMLRRENYQVFANYMKRFLEEYKKQGIDVWGVTTGNEPLDGFWSTQHSLINSMGWIPIDQVEWIRDNLGPTLKNSTFKDLVIIAHDDDRLTMPHVVPLLYRDKEAMKHVDGVGLHWYWDADVPAETMELLNYQEKDVFRLSTESCVFLSGVILGSLDRGFQYISSIIEYMHYGFVGWIDWNMALNPNGGPTYIKFFADSPIIVNASADEFYKQPMYYAMGHFSKNVVPGSVRIGLDVKAVNQTKVKTVAFRRPDDLTVVVIYNNGTSDVSLQVGHSGYFTEAITIEAKSMNTVVLNISNVFDNYELESNKIDGEFSIVN